MQTKTKILISVMSLVIVVATITAVMHASGGRSASGEGAIIAYNGAPEYVIAPEISPSPVPTPESRATPEVRPTPESRPEPEVPTEPEDRHTRALRIEYERAQFWNTITREKILYDIDYMLYVLEHNFPFLDSIYYRYGADMRTLGQELRTTFADETFNPDIDDFFELIVDFIDQGRRVGHLAVVTRRWLASGLGRGAITDIGPASQQFYGAIDRIDMREAVQGAQHEQYIVYANIIEEDRVGYMRLYQMTTLQRRDTDILRPFYAEIGNLKHLIVDVRGNPGGSLNVMLSITTPLLPHHTFARFYLFFPQGEYNFAHLQTAGLERENILLQVRYRFIDSRMRRSENSLHRISEDDWQYELLVASNYYIATQLYMGQSVMPPTILRTDFSGQLWILTDDESASATEWLTAMWSMTDVAIVVGERTRGVFGSPVFSEVRFALPNTGLIIVYDFASVYDRHGRPLSNGIDPDHFNRPGMDALETTLALIAEGVYR